MKTLASLPAALLVLTGAMLPLTASAQTATTSYSGLHRVTLRGSSDSIVAVPFARMDTLDAVVESSSANTIILKGTTGFAPQQFVPSQGQPDTFYVLVSSGTKAGSTYTITANTGNMLTVDLNGDTLTGLTAGDWLTIIPYWTLSTLFPNGQGIHASTSETNRGTEILVPDVNATVMNATPTRAFYLQDGHWREVGAGAALRDHVVILPDTSFVVRHNASTNTDWMTTGSVVPGKLLMVVGTNGTAKRDNYFGLQRPNAVSLGESGLVQSGAFATSATPGNRMDELLVFDNTKVGKNKSAAAVYYHWNGAWRKVGAGVTSFDATPVFTPGTGFVIRKGMSNATPMWENTPGY